MNELQTLLSTLGDEKTANLLQKVLPILYQRRQQLLASLAAEEWESASLQAHRLLASGHLLGSETLTTQLRAIERLDVEQLQQHYFQTQLAEQLTASLERLNQRL